MDEIVEMHVGAGWGGNAADYRSVLARPSMPRVALTPYVFSI